MTANDWEALIQRAVHENDTGKPEDLHTLAAYLETCDSAKQLLRDLGYGWAGLDILETVKLVPYARWEL